MPSAPNFSKPFRVPQSPSDTETRLTLLKVQHLYITKDYKMCSTECATLLARGEHRHPPLHIIQSSFLHFYAAICHESLAQPMQNLSPSKLANLYDARQHFEMALLKLDELRPHSRVSSRSQPPSLRGSGGSSGDAASPEPTWSAPQTPDQSPKSGRWTATTPARVTEISMADGQDAQNKNSPVSHQSDSNDEEIMMVSPAQWFNSKSSMNLLQENKTSKKDSPRLKHTFKTVAPTMRCSRLATDLFELVEHHISWIDRMVEDVSLAHQRRVTVQVSVPDVSKDVKSISQKDKHAGRRAEGWKRQRFDPRRTQELCKLALEEL